MTVGGRPDALTPFFAPRGVAVVGASPGPGEGRRERPRQPTQRRIRGPRLAREPAGGHCPGAAGNPSLLAISEPVDLAVIAVPASAVLPALKDCVAKGIRGAIVLSAGFREAGESGQAREAELRAWLREQPIRILGPNCLGWIRP